MRIKFNDKIYRLKEIESGVDSLMELVEEPKYKEGDFLHSDWENENITIIYRKRNGSYLYYHVGKSNRFGLCFDKERVWLDDRDFRLATESEKKELIDALTGVGKRWNTEKKCIEDIPVYKDGDFVVNDLNAILIFKEADGDRISDHAYLPVYGELVIDKVVSCKGIKRHATTEEKQRMIDALAERGKRWNKDKKCVEDIPQRKFKDGDFVYEDNRIMIVKSYPNNYHANLWYIYSEKPSYDSAYAVNFSSPTFRYATDEEKKLLIDAMKNDGKRWNAEKLEIEYIPQPKFKVGDSVKIKEGISSKTHRYAPCSFVETMDKYIGKKFIVDHVAIAGRHEVLYFMANNGYYYDENWLEPWSDEPKVGDWVAAWDVNRKAANVGILEAVGIGVFKYVVNGFQWMSAVKWDGTKEHLEKIRKGEI